MLVAWFMSDCIYVYLHFQLCCTMELQAISIIHITQVCRSKSGAYLRTNSPVRWALCWAVLCWHREHVFEYMHLYCIYILFVMWRCAALQAASISFKFCTPLDGLLYFWKLVLLSLRHYYCTLRWSQQIQLVPNEPAALPQIAADIAMQRNASKYSFKMCGNALLRTHKGNNGTISECTKTSYNWALYVIENAAKLLLVSWWRVMCRCRMKSKQKFS